VDALKITYYDISTRQVPPLIYWFQQHLGYNTLINNPGVAIASFKITSIEGNCCSLCRRVDFPLAILPSTTTYNKQCNCIFRHISTVLDSLISLAIPLP
jgi:hypothetical protein